MSSPTLFIELLRISLSLPLSLSISLSPSLSFYVVPYAVFIISDLSLRGVGNVPRIPPLATPLLPRHYSNIGRTNAYLQTLRLLDGDYVFFISPKSASAEIESSLFEHRRFPPSSRSSFFTVPSSMTISCQRSTSH